MASFPTVTHAIKHWQIACVNACASYCVLLLRAHCRLVTCEYTGLPDPTRWAYDVSRKRAGWANNELQYYSSARPGNSRIEKGALIIAGALNFTQRRCKGRYDSETE